jgi:NAD(P)H-dependent flavin oxidoreductase YrpB (nitropropane dioxygenase family)
VVLAHACGPRLRSREAPVVQAGMGSVARHELAAAVSEAGGLGTIAGVRTPIAAEIAAARRLTGRPIAVNLLLPFVRPGDADREPQASAVVPERVPPHSNPTRLDWTTDERQVRLMGDRLSWESSLGASDDESKRRLGP